MRLVSVFRLFAFHTHSLWLIIGVLVWKIQNYKFIELTSFVETSKCNSNGTYYKMSSFQSMSNIMQSKPPKIWHLFLSPNWNTIHFICIPKEASFQWFLNKLWSVVKDIMLLARRLERYCSTFLKSGLTLYTLAFKTF